MKKFYLFAIAALLCGSAAAEGRQHLATNRVEKSNSFTEKSLKGGLQLKRNAPVKEGAEGITSVEDMAGEWTLYCETLLTSGANQVDLVIEVADAEAGEIAITGWPQNFLVPATVDIEAGTVSIPNNVWLGRDSYGDNCFFYFKDITDEGGIEDGLGNQEFSVGTIIGNNIQFPELDIWAIGDPNDEDLGWWWLTYMNYMNKPIQEDPNIGWEVFSTATFLDGWIIPAAGEDPADYPWTVTISKSTEEEGLYRIDNPYQATDCPLGSDGENGYIVFNMEDPDFVRVLKGYFSGFRNGTQKVYFFNIEGYYSEYDPEVLMEAFEEDGLSWSNFSEDVVTIYNCRFDFSSACATPYIWTGVDESLMVSKIIFDGVNVATIGTNKDSKVEFYNLQGMRVENPQPGQLLIKRTAKGAVKTIIR